MEQKGSPFVALIFRRLWLSFGSLGHVALMLQIHTSKDSEGVREALRRLVADHDRASGHIDGDTFRLYPKPRRRGVPVTLYGRILPDADGSLLRAWPIPHWMMIVWIASLQHCFPRLA
jgi:hypothetical protein